MAKDNPSGPRKGIPVKPLDYPPKVLLAWGEAVAGNAKIRNWLTQNGYPELGIFIFALHNQDDARNWLRDNGYPHLLAMIAGGEGDENAMKWLFASGYQILGHMAAVIDRSEPSLKWLKDNNHELFAGLAQKMRIVKDRIDHDNYDPHKISF